MNDNHNRCSMCNINRANMCFKLSDDKILRSVGCYDVFGGFYEWCWTYEEEYQYNKNSTFIQGFHLNELSCIECLTHIKSLPEPIEECKLCFNSETWIIDENNKTSVVYYCSKRKQRVTVFNHYKDVSNVQCNKCRAVVNELVEDWCLNY